MLQQQQGAPGKLQSLSHAACMILPWPVCPVPPLAATKAMTRSCTCGATPSGFKGNLSKHFWRLGCSVLMHTRHASVQDRAVCQLERTCCQQQQVCRQLQHPQRGQLLCHVPLQASQHAIGQIQQCASGLCQALIQIRALLLLCMPPLPQLLPCLLPAWMLPRLDHVLRSMASAFCGGGGGRGGAPCANVSGQGQVATRCIGLFRQAALPLLHVGISSCQGPTSGRPGPYGPGPQLH